MPSSDNLDLRELDGPNYRRRLRSKVVKLSIVAPCYNEEETLFQFTARTIAAARQAVGEKFQLILVNDGSNDRTWRTIQDLTEAQPQIVGVNLSRNHGHQLAVTAGLAVAGGDRVLIIDADLQDPPELLADMMALMDQGYDVVYGKRRSRRAETGFKRFTSKLFYRMLDAVSDVNIPRDVGDFRLMSRRVVDRLNAMPEQDRFLRGMVAWLGGRQTDLLYDRDPRFAGETAYTLSKMIHLALDGLIGFSTAPLRLAVVLASAGAVLGMALAVYALWSFIEARPERGWTSLAIITVFFGVGQFMCLAIIGSYVGRIYIQGKNRPLFIVDDIIPTSIALRMEASES
jgi:glycosyltransferase involved in cell wall biosynthesis